jgi:hypothetical protein
VLIDDHVMSELAALVPLAPLHQTHNIARSVRSPQPASCRQFCNVGAAGEETGWAVASTPQKFIVEGNVGQLAKEANQEFSARYSMLMPVHFPFPDVSPHLLKDRFASDQTFVIVVRRVPRRLDPEPPNI